MADKVITGRLIKGLVIMGLAGLIAGFMAFMALGLIGKSSTTGKRSGKLYRTCRYLKPKSNENLLNSIPLPNVNELIEEIYFLNGDV